MEAILFMESFDDSVTETMSMAVSEETAEMGESLDTEDLEVVAPRNHNSQYQRLEVQIRKSKCQILFASFGYLGELLR